MGLLDEALLGRALGRPAVSEGWRVEQVDWPAGPFCAGERFEAPGTMRNESDAEEATLEPFCVDWGAGWVCYGNARFAAPIGERDTTPASFQAPKFFNGSETTFRVRYLGEVRTFTAVECTDEEPCKVDPADISLSTCTVGPTELSPGATAEFEAVVRNDGPCEAEVNARWSATGAESDFSISVQTTATIPPETPAHRLRTTRALDVPNDRYAFDVDLFGIEAGSVADQLVRSLPLA